LLFFVADLFGDLELFKQMNGHQQLRLIHFPTVLNKRIETSEDS